jgi:DNA-binding MarR family transcriptional regulator
VADRLHSTAIHLLRRVRGQDAQSGLSPARLSALSIVVFGGPVSLGDLAAAEQVRAPTMTRLVQALEADGLVTTRRDGADARVVRVHATARGRKLLEEGRSRRVAQLAELLAELSLEDLAALDEAAGVLAGLLKPRR